MKSLTNWEASATILEVRQFVHRVLLWTSLRAIGNSAPARLTIVIPLVGYLIIFNEGALHYFALSQRIFGGGSVTPVSGAAHVSLRLLSIYFGLCLIAAASTVYVIACPREIKQFGSAADYIGAGENYSVAQLIEIASRTDKNDTRLNPFRNYVNSLKDEARPVRAGERRGKMGETEANGLHYFFNALDQTRYLARILCGTFYSVGLLVLAIPSADAFVRISKVLVQAIVTALTS